MNDDAYAESVAGNWKKFMSFAWFDKPYDADNWLILDIENRDSNTRIRSNANFMRTKMEPFTKGDDPDCRFERHSCWLVGWREAITIRALKAGKATDALKVYRELMMSCCNQEAVIFDPDDYVELLESDDEPMRAVRILDYELRIYDTNECGFGQWTLAYTFKGPDGELIFSGCDFSPGNGISVDGDDSLRSLLGFLTLRPGDTDSEYFNNYNERQMAFVDGDAEEVGLWALSAENGNPSLEFEEIE